MSRDGVDCSSSEDEESMVAHKLTSGSIDAAQTPATSAKRKNKPNPLATPLVEEAKKQPEGLKECRQQQEREDSDILDTRKTAEDVFLQMFAPGRVITLCVKPVASNDSLFTCIAIHPGTAEIKPDHPQSHFDELT